MSDALLPTIQEILVVFTDEVTRLGGKICDVFDDGDRLFLRATLPETRDVLPGDSVQKGIAVRTFDEMLLVHPFVFRKVCSNGAIWAHSTDSFQVERADFAASHERVEAAMDRFRDALAACDGGDSFQQAVGDMRVAANVPGDVDKLLNVMPMLAIGRGLVPRELVARFIERHVRDRDPSLFGLMNAVTSVARDTRDPEMRWRLEELGGGVPALVRPVPMPSGAAADLVLG
jgi:hypothetical protein